MTDPDHADIVLGEPDAEFVIGGTRYGYFGEDPSRHDRDFWCNSCGERISRVYPVDALEEVRKPADKTLGVCRACLGEGQDGGK